MHLIVLAFVLFSAFNIQQDSCIINLPTLKGKYEGDCKNGIANGKGRAVGTDIYEGEFKNGLPHGKGTYQWKNGSIYTGQWREGLMHGEGSYFTKTSKGKDSLVKGEWKKGVYVSKKSEPYTIYAKTKSVGEILIEKRKDQFNTLTIFTHNTSATASSINNNLVNVKITDIKIVNGYYQRILTNDSQVKKTETNIYEIQFPLRIKIMIDNTEEVEVEFKEPGSYIMNIYLNM